MLSLFTCPFLSPSFPLFHLPRVSEAGFLAPRLLAKYRKEVNRKLQAKEKVLAQKAAIKQKALEAKERARELRRQQQQQARLAKEAARAAREGTRVSSGRKRKAAASDSDEDSDEESDEESEVSDSERYSIRAKYALIHTFETSTSESEADSADDDSSESGDQMDSDEEAGVAEEEVQPARPAKIRRLTKRERAAAEAAAAAAAKAAAAAAARREKLESTYPNAMYPPSYKARRIVKPVARRRLADQLRLVLQPSGITNEQYVAGTVCH